jgi:hypothetical protein
VNSISVVRPLSRLAKASIALRGHQAGPPGVEPRTAVPDLEMEAVVADSGHGSDD